MGIQLGGADTSVFKPDWGIDVNRVLQPIRFPSRDVIAEAPHLHQVAFRRPPAPPTCSISPVVWATTARTISRRRCELLLDQDIAQQYLLQGHPGDVSTVILFNDGVINQSNIDQWTVTGNDGDALRHLERQIQATNAGGGTNIFDSTRFALQRLAQLRTQECLPAVIVMTDGQDNAGNWGALQSYVHSTENDIPVFAITFGDADASQLEPMTSMTYGRIFNGTDDLVTAFREAKGYN
ncbi:MAG: VWA domain-containing protein [Anaerolineae bacterium]